MNEERTVGFTREALLRDTWTDWARVDAMSEREVEAGAAADPENPAWTEEELAAAELVMPGTGAKAPISIRPDEEVLEFFRSQGPGYQSRINAVLLGYVRGRRRRSP
jgi:uncharacterized protein (DUF4415 family)